MENKNSAYGFIVLGILLAACAVLSAGGAARYGNLSRQAHACDIGMGYVQDIADMLSGTEGSMDWIPDMFPGAVFENGTARVYFDRDMRPCGGPELDGYEIRAGGVLHGTGSGSADVGLYGSDGRALFEITASWQEALE